MNEIVATGGTFAEMERLAIAIAKSGMFGMKTPEQALVLMAISQAEGRHPALAARDYDIIQGRPAKKAEAMLRDFFEGGGKVEWHTLTDENADATFSHPQGGSARIGWNMERARTAGLMSKDNYKKFPRQMLRSRVVSEGVRTVWPLATSGMYVPEEAADIPAKPFTGTTVDAEPEAPVRAAAAAVKREARIAKLAPTYEEQPPVNPPAGPDAKWHTFLGKLQAACAAATTAEEAAAEGGRPSVASALETGPEWVQEEITNILALSQARFDSANDGWPGPREGDRVMELAFLLLMLVVLLVGCVAIWRTWKGDWDG
jgi:hypothetical protein